MFHVRPESGEPIYLQLVRQITHAITSGALRTGARLPTIRQLAADLVINPNTVARAYRELERSGLVSSGTRRGTVVKNAPPRLLLEERRRRLHPHLDSVIAEARVLGFSAAELQRELQRRLRAMDTGQDGDPD